MNPQVVKVKVTKDWKLTLQPNLQEELLMLRGSYYAYSGITLRHRAYKNTYALYDEGHVGRS